MAKLQHVSTHRGAAYALALILAVGFGLTLVVFYPGYITVDARYVYAEARAWHFGHWQSQAMGLLGLVAYGVLLRPNAIIAAPILAAYAVSPLRLTVKRTAMVYLPAAVLFAALVPLVYYGLLGAQRQNPLHSILVFDLGGITHFSA